MRKIDKSLIAPCGMNCGVCKAHLREKNACPGCYQPDINKAKSCVECKIKACGERKGKYCFMCDKFPCDRLKHLDERYRKKYEMSEIENLEFIRSNGINEFVKSENKRWLSDKGIYCVHDKRHY